MRGENRFDTEELRQYAENHLSREVELLRWTGSFLNAFSTASLSSERIAGDIADAFQRSALESFGMHARNLIDFLYVRNYYHSDWPTDIVIEDYVSDSVISTKLIPITETLKDARIKADKLIAHLTVERETFGFYQKAWMYTFIAIDLLNALRSIANEIPAPLKSNRFLEAISTSLPLLFDIDLRQYSLEDRRGPGLAMEFGMWYQPDSYKQP